MTELLRLEQTSRIHWCQCLFSGRVIQVAQDHVWTTSEVLEEGTLHQFLGQSVPVFCHSHWQNVFPDVQRSYCVSACAHCLSCCHWTSMKAALLHLPYSLPSKVWWDCPSHFFPRLNSSYSLSLSTQESCSCSFFESLFWSGSIMSSYILTGEPSNR